MVKPIEAELTKYMQNVYNTYRILFANGFYEVCKHNNVEYNNIVELVNKLHKFVYESDKMEEYIYTIYKWNIE